MMVRIINDICSLAIKKGETYIVDKIIGNMYQILHDGSYYLVYKEDCEIIITKNVVAKETHKPSGIVKGRKYEVMDETTDDLYLIINDYGDEWHVFKHRFYTEEELKQARKSPGRAGSSITCNGSKQKLEDEIAELRKILRVPDGDNLMMYAQGVRNLADAMLKTFE